MRGVGRRTPQPLLHFLWWIDGLRIELLVVTWVRPLQQQRLDSHGRPVVEGENSDETEKERQTKDFLQGKLLIEVTINRPSNADRLDCLVTTMRIYINRKKMSISLPHASRCCGFNDGASKAGSVPWMGSFTQYHCKC